MGPDTAEKIQEGLDQLAGWAERDQLPDSWRELHRFTTVHIGDLAEPERSRLRQLAVRVGSACVEAETRRLFGG